MTPISSTLIAGVEPSAEAARKLFPPKLLGPVWVTGEDDLFIIPERTLGWEVLRWCATWLVNPDTGKPWMFTPEQARFILWLYELDEHGERTYSQAVLQRLKGWGKDPVAAALCIVELVGPVAFLRWDETRQGKVVGQPKPSAWVQIVAVAADQTKNTMLMIPSMLPPATREHFQLDVQKQLVQIKGRPMNRIETISSSHRAMEGNRPSFGIANETHHWVPSRGGKDLYLTLKNNLTKNVWGGVLLCITNAFMPGEDSVAENMRLAEQAVLDGKAAFAGTLYDSLEAHAAAPLTPDWAPFIVDIIKGDAWWLKTRSIVEALQNTAINMARLRRFWFNQIVAAEDALYTEADWDAREREAILKKGDAVVLGFDGGKTDDDTALVAIRLSDRMVFTIAIWQKPDGAEADTYQINPDAVDAMVEACFRDYDVRAFYADVALWESYIGKWSDEHRETLRIKASSMSTVGFDMRGNVQKLTMGNEALMAAILDGRLHHDGDKILRRHALNARRRENRYGLTFGKESRESPLKVDGYAALLLAFIAMNDLNESGKNVTKAQGAFYQF